jgi:PhnB protein
MIVPNLHFNGQAKEAIEFYADIFNVDATNIITYGDFATSTGEMPPEYKDWVVYSTLELFAGYNLVINDSQPGATVSFGENFSIVVQLADQDKLNNIFNKLQEGGKIEMPLQPTPFSPLYGMVTDKFKVVWQLTAAQ